jgi:hypothetical protein
MVPNFFVDSYRLFTGLERLGYVIVPHASSPPNETAFLARLYTLPDPNESQAQFDIFYHNDLSGMSI